MKTILIFIVVIVTHLSLKAQTPKDPALNHGLENFNAFTNNIVNIPNFKVIKTHNREFSIDTLKWMVVKSEWISATSYLYGPKAIAKYGDSAKDGVAIYTIDDNTYPGAFSILKKELKELKINNP